MANTEKTPLQSLNLWTNLATLVAAAFSYFSLTPDMSAAQALGDEAHRAVDAIQSKNYVVFATVIFNVANILYHLWKKR